MSLVREIIKCSHKDYPAIIPSLEINKEAQSLLNNGKCVIIECGHYKEKFYVFKEDFSKELSHENISVRSVNDLNRNPIRQKELESFYKKHPKFK
jgi:hypothetical protein